MKKNSDKIQNKAIQKQIKLPLMKSIEISFESLRIRFWRSFITIGGIFLAIAFLMSIFTSTSINLALAKGASLEVRSRLGEMGDIKASQMWLVVLSLMACTVGITNAMLMSVTERYREIGTMKCLGALDSFIVRLFLIESGFLGLVGSVSGAIAGTTIMTLVSIIRYGSDVIATYPLFEILKYGIFSIVIGTVLSIIAAIYPAYRAAKMTPADAMRTEV